MGYRMCVLATGPLMFLAAAFCPAVGAGTLRTPGFIENLGQFDSRAAFVSQGAGATVFLVRDGIRLGLADGWNLFWTFEGASPDAAIEGSAEEPGRYHYFLGNDPTRWVRGARSYSRVRYRELYPGIDLEVRREREGLVYDLFLEPWADLDSVVVRCEGIDSLAARQDGTVVLRLGDRELIQAAPQTFELMDGAERRPVTCWVRAAERGRFGFVAPDRDRSRRLLVDPTLVFSTLFGGVAWQDRPMDAQVGADGYLHVVGATTSPDFPVTPGAYDNTIGSIGADDAFVLKLAPDGSSLVWCTFIGGNGDDSGLALAVDLAGGTCVAGGSLASDLPTTPGAYQGTFAGVIDGFVARLSPNGDALVYSTYLGGNATDIPRDIAVDSIGRAYVTGETDSLDFPTTPGGYDTVLNLGEAFISVLSPQGSQLAAGTYLGGTSSGEEGFGIALDPSGAILIMGRTSSPDFPASGGTFDTSFNGSTDVFGAKLTPDCAALLWATYLGGYASEQNLSMTSAADGDMLIVGETGSSNYPTTPGSFSPYFHGQADGFLTRLDGSGASLVYSTFIGGSSGDYARGGVALDSSGCAYVHGETGSGNFPVTPDAHQPTMAGGLDAWLTRFDPSGSQLLYSTFIGGSQQELTFAVAAGGQGRVYAVGETMSSDFPVTPGAFDTSLSGVDGYVVAFDFCGPVTAYGAACPGSGGFLPTLSLSGCSAAGATVTIEVAGGLGSRNAFLFLGMQQAALPIGGGCSALIYPLIGPFGPLPLTPGGPGGGSTSVLAWVPPACAFATVTMQAFVDDPAGAAGLSATNGLQVAIE